MSDDTEVIDDDTPEIPEIPEYNAKTIRRASRRGVARVALIAALIVGLGIAAVGVGTGVLARRSVDENHTLQTLAYGQLASHPGYRIGGVGPAAFDSSFGRLGQFDAHVTFERPDGNGVFGNPAVSRVHKPLYGYPRLTEEIPSSPVEDVIDDVHPTKARTRAVLDGLPTSTACGAVIGLANPVGDADLARVMQRIGFPNSPDNPLVLDSVLIGPKAATATSVPDTFTNVVGWVGESPIADFTDWAKSLHDSDDDLLSQMSAGYVVDVAQSGDELSIQGLVAVGASPGAMREMLKQPDVASIAVSECDFDLSGASTNT